MSIKTTLLNLLLILLISGCAQQQIAGSSAADTSANTSNWQPKLNFSLHDDNLWSTMTNEFSLDHAKSNPLVQSQLHWFATHPHYLERVSARAKPFLYYIVNELKRRNMPTELALIPIIETAYNPFAYSPSGAAGLWQFMPVTATHLGVRETWWFDGRRDLVESTNAALNYLSYLHKFFKGNWHLAIAAYFAGEGTIDNARKSNARRGFNTDIWSLHLSDTARAYLPRLLAIAIVVEDPEEYNNVIPKIADEPYFKQVNIGSQLDLAHAAQLADIGIEEIYLLNPGYNRWATDPNGPHKLLIPAQKANVFKQRLAKLPKDQRMSWQRYRVKSGDSLSMLAHKFDTTIPIIRQVNKLPNNNLRVNQVLYIPIAQHQLPSHSRLLALYRVTDELTHKKVIMQPTKSIYTVKGGDSLWKIAHQHKVSVKDLQRWNKLSRKTILQPGKELVIWKKKKTTVPTSQWQRLSKPRVYTSRYTVKSGDVLSSIALRHHTTVAEIKSRNHLHNDLLHIGQVLSLRVNSAKQSVAHKSAPKRIVHKPAPKRYYTVKPGDTLSGIAHKQHVTLEHIRQINHFNSKLLHPGQKIRIA